MADKKSFWTREIAHRNGETETVLNIPNVIKAIVIAVILLVVVVTAWPFKIVGATERGIRYTFGKPETTVLQPGIHSHAPFIGNIKTWSIEPVKTSVDIDIDKSGAISKDNQIIGTRIVVYYRYDEDKIYDIATNYQTKTSIENPLASNVNSIMKTIIGGYTIFDLAANQEVIGTKLQSSLTSAITRYPIEITQVNVSNFDWNSAFDAQINATMEAAQRVRQAEQQAMIAEQENRKLSIEAEAQAKALVATASGKLEAAELNAKAQLVEAEATAEANRLRSQVASLQYQRALWEHDEEMLRLNKWNGVNTSTYIPMLPPGYTTASGANTVR